SDLYLNIFPRNFQLNWYAANTFCKSQNWQLMAIEDIYSHLNLLGFLSYYDILNTRFWTAGNSLLTKGAWRWGVGEQATEFNFTNWGSAYPSDEDSNRKCVQLAPRTLDWEDESCSIQREFICQKSAIQ
ncbi:galactose-specific lectin nattectin-like, partial [Ceratitis capitata]|uniref:galactose-specific lectin nattectin-like n=1 Tax=Ceratitis capitata TaxID=7213 RepID=UPI000A11E654